jgi:hypothetical protein
MSTDYRIVLALLAGVAIGGTALWRLALDGRGLAATAIAL